MDLNFAIWSCRRRACIENYFIDVNWSLGGMSCRCCRVVYRPRHSRLFKHQVQRTQNARTHRDEKNNNLFKKKNLIRLLHQMHERRVQSVGCATPWMLEFIENESKSKFGKYSHFTPSSYLLPIRTFFSLFLSTDNWIHVSRVDVMRSFNGWCDSNWSFHTTRPNSILF